MSDDLTPSALQQLRLFVSGDGTLRPWSSIEEVMEHLIVQIDGHRGDDAWRAELEKQVLAMRAVDTQASPWRSLVTPENLDALMGEIYGPAGGAPPRLASLLRGMSAPAVLGLAAMTMAIGCNNLCPEADGIPADEQETYCELVAYINDVDIEATTKDSVLECLPELTDASRQDLVDLFDSYSVEQIAEYLEEMATQNCAVVGDDDDDTAGDDDDTSDDDDDTGH